MRKAFVLALFCFLLAFSLNIQALTYSISGHSINVFVDEKANATVKERFYLRIPSTEIESFKQKSSELGTDLKAWQSFDPNFSVSINSMEDIIPGSGSISFNETAETKEKYVELSYALKTPVFIKAVETTRMIEFKLSKNAIRNFIESPFFIVPQNTTITFILPLQVTVLNENVMPTAEISTDNQFNYVSWVGLKKTTNVSFTYTYWKDIAPSISIAVILKEFIEQEDITKGLVLLLFVILLVFAYLNRERIENRIQEFIEKHTEIKEKED